jgi:hypothetical protein
MPIDSKFLKKIDSLISVQQERLTTKLVKDKDLTFSLCDRDNISDYSGNYFPSFGLPYESSYFGTGSTMSKRYPELQQLNVDRIILIPIPSSAYSELIDGRTIKLNVPQGTGSTSMSDMSAITIYSSTYTGDEILKYESSPLLGNNIAFLFADAINKPYTGKTISDIGEIIDDKNQTTWGFGLEDQDRPAAVMYKEVQGFYNTDTRVGKYSVPVPVNYPDGRAGYNYDVPVGFVSLDEGFLILTHTAITSNFPWISGFTQDDQIVTSTGISNLKNIYFTGTVTTNLAPNGPESGEKAAQLRFKDINTAFRTTAVCLGLPREFYISNNPTWDRARAIVNLNEESGFISFEPLYITELGLYNEENELIAIAKTSEPVEKDYTSVVTFNVNIDF